MSSPRRVVVTIGGVEYTDDVLDGVQIEMGGRTAWEQSVAGLTRAIIYQEDPGIVIGDTMTIDIESPEGVAATGGTVTTITDGGVDYIVHTFTSDGTLTVTDGGEVEYLIVGGGGGGGGANIQTGGGGGGAGGLLAGTTTINASTYAVTVGAGGTGGTPTVNSGTNGGSSSFAGLTALGGGRGATAAASSATNNAQSGGSGGGGAFSSAIQTFGAASSDAAQGNAGGGNGNFRSSPYPAGGGGGAGQVGGTATAANRAGDGGNGVASTISGASVTYAGGGGGGVYSSSGGATPGVGGAGGGGAGGANTNGQNAVDGLGGGGGGGGQNDNGGDGGDGVVIIRYPASQQRMFTGVVDSTSASITEIGPLWDVTASGPLTQAGRRELLSIIAADTDGDQIALLAQEALGTTWEGTFGTWAGQTRTWDGFAVDTSAIDQPGQYALAAIDSIPQNVADAMSDAAFSGSGWLYETRHGLLGFADSTRRELTPEDDYILIPANVTSRNAFVTSTQAADIANVVVVQYDGGEVEAKATDSIQIYGRYARDYQTTLADQSAAEQYAVRRLQLEGSPRLNVAGAISIDLDLCTDELVDQLVLVERNTPVILEGVPTYLAPDGLYRGFVEGYVWNLSSINPTLSLFVSDYSLSNFGLRWNAAGPTQWNEVGASLTWNDATEALA